MSGGAIDDFSKSVAKIPYVATVELSGTNGDGYVEDANILSFLFQIFRNFICEIFSMAIFLRYSITFTNRYGFMMPEKYIRRIGEEMWEGMKVSAKYARNSGLGPSKTATEEEVRERVWLSNHPQ